MNEIILSTKKDIEQLIRKAVKETVISSFPDLLRKAKRKEWLNTVEVMQFLNISRRQAQFLRDSKQLPFTQNGRTIRYHIDEVEAFLNRGKVNSNSNVGQK